MESGRWSTITPTKQMKITNKQSRDLWKLERDLRCAGSPLHVNPHTITQPCSPGLPTSPCIVEVQATPTRFGCRNLARSCAQSRHDRAARCAFTEVQATSPRFGRRILVRYCVQSRHDHAARYAFTEGQATPTRFGRRLLNIV